MLIRIDCRGKMVLIVNNCHTAIKKCVSVQIIYEKNIVSNQFYKTENSFAE